MSEGRPPRWQIQHPRIRPCIHFRAPFDIPIAHLSIQAAAHARARVRARALPYEGNDDGDDERDERAAADDAEDDP